MSRNATLEDKMTLEEVREEILLDYSIACLSREASLLGRKEVLTGKAKFGIFGDGKELAQVCMAKQFRARRLAQRLLPRHDLHVRHRRAHRAAMVRAALRPCRREGRPQQRRPQHERPLRHAQPRSSTASGRT
jgi:hypothetical protein